MRRVGKGPRRRRGVGRRRGRHERVLVPELAVDEDEPGRLLEQVLDGAAAQGVLLAKLLVDGRHPAPDAYARRKGGERVAALEDGHLEDVGAHGAVGRRLRVEAVPERKLAQLGAADDGGKVVLVLGAVGAAARAQALDLVLLALDLVLAARAELVAHVVHPPARISEDLVLEPAAPATSGRRVEFRYVGDDQCDLEGEEWKAIVPEDWFEGGKYCLE